MNDYSKKKANFLLTWMDEFLLCKNKQEVLDQFEALKEAIPFDHYGIARFMVSKQKVYSIETIEWFKTLNGFEEFFLTDKMYEKDTITRAILERPDKEKLFADFWSDIYVENPDSEFLQKASELGMPEKGYSATYKPNESTCISFSIAGNRLGNKRDETIIRSMFRIVRLMENILDDAKVGITEEFTDKQVEYFKFLRSSMTYKHIATLKATSPQAVGKQFAAIKGKIGDMSLRRGDFSFFGKKE